MKAAKQEARKAKVAAVMAAASPALLAGQAMAADAMFQVAEFDGTGEINGGAGALCS